MAVVWNRKALYLLGNISLGVTTTLCLLLSTATSFQAATPVNSLPTADLSTPRSTTDDPVDWVRSGKAAYQSGQYAAAITAWLQAVQGFASRGDRPNQAAVLSNLALAYQQLGQWTEANQAIADSVKLLQGESKGGSSNSPALLLAQVLNIQGSLQLAQGQAEQALETWQQATAAYQRAGDATGTTRSLINESQALRTLGLYPRAKSTLEQVNQTLQTQPDSLLKAAGLLNYGDALRLVGDFEKSEKALQTSLAIAQRLQSPSDSAVALMSLGNTARARQLESAALQYYRQAIAAAPASITSIQAQLNQLRVLVESNQRTEAETLIATLKPQLDGLTASRTSVYARVSFAQSVFKLRGTGNQQTDASSNAVSLKDVAQVLAIAIQHAQQLNDSRAQSYGLGYLGELYERSQQFPEAKKLTEKALLLAQLSNSSDISYRWQWQLGRILNAQNNSDSAIAAYGQAVQTLNSIRNDLVASSPDLQFSFRESVEPVYREFVALLLQTQPSGDTSQENLKKARQVIESLQLAELDNYFREACLTGRPAQVDQVDAKSAVVYPIVLRDRLEVVLSLPGKPLRHYSSPVSQKILDQLTDKMRRSLRTTSTGQERTEIAEQLYNLLIRPAVKDLAASQIQTLAFVLDGSLKNIPMAALYDGQHYLIEQYSIALTPGLQLIDPRPLQRQQLKVLVGALSEERQGFSALPGVETEIQQIKSEVASEVLFNKTFTTETFQKQISAVPFRVVHLATHGQFSSSADETFILTWDRRIDVKQLGELLQAREQETRPIELLVLSACQTAEGDKRATLGLAGIAVRSGARSTLATLWSVDDQATSQLMTLFYQELSRSGTTKAEALRQAQLQLLKKPEFKHPFYWAPFVLVGNWL